MYKNLQVHTGKVLTCNQSLIKDTTPLPHVQGTTYSRPRNLQVQSLRRTIIPPVAGSSGEHNTPNFATPSPGFFTDSLQVKNTCSPEWYSSQERFTGKLPVCSTTLVPKENTVVSHVAGTGPQCVSSDNKPSGQGNIVPPQVSGTAPQNGQTTRCTVTNKHVHRNGTSPKCAVDPGTATHAQFHVIRFTNTLGYLDCLYVRITDTQGTVTMHLLHATAADYPPHEQPLPRSYDSPAVHTPQVPKSISPAFGLGDVTSTDAKRYHIYSEDAALPAQDPRALVKIICQFPRDIDCLSPIET